jgi:DNA primase
MEQTPSFVVDDAAEQFRCLGCGARGDTDFVLRSEVKLFVLE